MRWEVCFKFELFWFPQEPADSRMFFVMFYYVLCWALSPSTSDLLLVVCVAVAVAKVAQHRLRVRVSGIQVASVLHPMQSSSTTPALWLFIVHSTHIVGKPAYYRNFCEGSFIIHHQRGTSE